MSEASRAMRIAGEVRSEGMDASEALEEGWRQVRGDDGGIGSYAAPSILLMAAIGYLIWAAIKHSWTPWQGITFRRPMRQLPKPVPTTRFLEHDNIITPRPYTDPTRERVRLILP